MNGLNAIVEKRQLLWLHQDGELREAPEREFQDPLEGRIVLTLKLDGCGSRAQDELSGKVPFGTGILEATQGKIVICSRAEA